MKPGLGDPRGGGNGGATPADGGALLATAPPAVADAQYRRLLEMVPFPVVIARADDSTLVFVNERAARLVGLGRAQLLGQPALASYRNPEDRQRVLAQLADGCCVDDMEVEFVRADGTPLWVSVSACLTQVDGVACVLSALADITERRRTEEMLRQAHAAAEGANRKLMELNAQLEALASTDRLTGARNRRWFDSVSSIEARRSTRYREPLSLLLMDLDHFKAINDSHGHGVGDQVLAGFAEAVREHIRASDSLTRWGGEEFILLTPSTDLSEAGDLAEKLRAMVERRDFGAAGRVTVSIGVAQYVPGESLDACVRRADEALYRAKQAGRNRVMSAIEGASGELPASPFRFTWHRAYESGHPLVDAQHRELFATANRLFTSVVRHEARESIEAQIRHLLSAVEEHFEHEEALLERVGYHDFAAHRQEHTRILAEGRTLFEGFRAGTLVLPQLIDFVINQLVVKHILESDQRYFPFLQPEAVADAAN